MNRNHTIDLFRLFSIFFILIVHTDYGILPEWISNYIKVSSRFAVPFYFLISGYFLGNGFNDSKLYNSINKLLLIFFNVNVIYIPILAIMMLFNKKNFIFNFEVLMTGIYFHLWFLGSLIFGYFFIWFILKNFSEKFLGFISLIILLFALFSDSYDLLFGLNINFNVFRFLESIPFLFIGLLVYKYNLKANIWITIFLFILGFYFQFFEFDFLREYSESENFNPQILFGSVMISISILFLCLKIRVSDNYLSEIGKKYSLLIYLYHPISYLFIWSSVKFIFPNYWMYIYVFNPILAFLFTILGLKILNFISPKIFQFISGKISFSF